MNDSLYREQLLDYYKNPTNKRIMQDYDLHKKDSNPLCGDEIEVFVKLEDAKIKDISFTGTGCVISMSVASMLMEYLEGKSVDEIKNMSREQLLDMVGLKLTPTRVKCAMLSLNALKKSMIEESDKNV
jgi:nitrogen fixation protein NifU and related proteins